MRVAGVWRDQVGQGTVEWTRLVALVLALLVALGAAGVRMPGAGLAEAIVAKIECALGEDSTCASGAAEPALVRAYGSRLAAIVRAHAPEVDYERGMTALPVDFQSCRGPVCGNGPPAGAVWRSQSGEPAAAFVRVVDCRRPGAMVMPGIHCDGRGFPNNGDFPERGGPLAGHLYIQYWLYYESSSSLRALQPVLDPLGADAFHQDDWESYQVRIDADGSCESRASSHNGYNYDGGIGGWPSDTGLFHRAAWARARVARSSPAVATPATSTRTATPTRAAGAASATRRCPSTAPRHRAGRRPRT
jgi:hypothetical protein